MIEQWLENICLADSLEILEKLRVEILGKKGALTTQFAKIKDISNDKKKEFAQNLMSKKQILMKQLKTKKNFC